MNDWWFRSRPTADLVNVVGGEGPFPAAFAGHEAFPDTLDFLGEAHVAVVHGAFVELEGLAFGEIDGGGDVGAISCWCGRAQGCEEQDEWEGEDHVDDILLGD